VGVRSGKRASAYRRSTEVQALPRADEDRGKVSGGCAWAPDG